MAQAARSIGDALGVATVGDTVILKGATSNTYNGFKVKDGGTVTAEIPGVEYPEVTGTVDFNGDMPNGAIVEYLELNGASPSIYMSFATAPTGVFLQGTDKGR